MGGGGDSLEDVDDEVGAEVSGPSWNLPELRVSVGLASSGKARPAHRAWICPSCGGVGTAPRPPPLSPAAARPWSALGMRRLPLSAATARGAFEPRLRWKKRGALRSSDVWDPGGSSVPLTGLRFAADWARGLYKLPSDSNVQPSVRTTACCGRTHASIVLTAVHLHYLIQDFHPVFSSGFLNPQHQHALGTPQTGDSPALIKL